MAARFNNYALFVILSLLCLYAPIAGAQAPAVPAVPPQDPGGNRRGTFAATPSGKPGAAGTPDIAGTGSASGAAGAGKSNGLPPGLSVGAAPDHQPGGAVAGNGPGTGDGGSGNARRGSVGELGSTVFWPSIASP